MIKEDGKFACETLAPPPLPSRDRRVIRGRNICPAVAQLVAPELAEPRRTSPAVVPAAAPSVSCIKVCVQSRERNSSAGAPARRLFHKSFKLLSSRTDIPPHKESVSHLADAEKPLKKISFPAIYLLFPPHALTQLRRLSSAGKVLISRISAHCDCFIYRQRRRQGRGLASRGINLPGFTNKPVTRDDGLKTCLNAFSEGQLFGGKR